VGFFLLLFLPRLLQLMITKLAFYRLSDGVKWHFLSCVDLYRVESRSLPCLSFRFVNSSFAGIWF
jgi:hypothetical protein